VTRVNSQARFPLDEINEKALEQTNNKPLLHNERSQLTTNDLVTTDLRMGRITTTQ